MGFANGVTRCVCSGIDTGIDYTHPDLGNYLPLGFDFYNNDTDPFDDNGHGTHVAGTIAASIDNALGVAGLANVSFFAEKFLSSGGFGSDIGGAAAIVHAVDQGAHILSNSWGGYGESQILREAVDYALNAGVIVVAAAGNDGITTPLYPAAFPGVIAVGATDASDSLVSFSNYGDWVDVTAPGVDILSTVPFGGYEYFSGTSMATPHVSGLLALLKSHFPTYTPQMLEELLIGTALDLGDPGFDPFYGWGRIDAASAIYGLQDHNLRASLNVSSIVPFNSTVIGTADILNRGLYDESNVTYTLLLDGIVLDSGAIPLLLTGQEITIEFSFLAAELRDYNLTLIVDPVFNETVIADNRATKLVSASLPIIQPLSGNVLAYGESIGSEHPYEIKWEVVDSSNLEAVTMASVVYDPTLRQDVFVQEFIVNAFTRETNFAWDLFPYWIDPNLSIGDTFELFTKGQFVSVVGETMFPYYGQFIDAWIVDDGFELVYFSKSDGILLGLTDYINNSLPHQLMFTNVLPSAFELHNVRNTLVGHMSGAVDEPVTIEVMVQNTGEFVEDVFGEIWIDENSVALFNVTGLQTGQYAFVQAQWTPSMEGQFNVSAFVYSVAGESYIDDNFDSRTLFVADLQNYEVDYPPFEWYDAVANGFNLNLWGDDVSIGLQLGFEFQFYDASFSEVYISSNGWLSFFETNPTAFFAEPFPNDIHPYAVAPFWSDLKAEGNVYAWVTPDFVVVEYVNYRYLWDDMAGTFAVMFCRDGEILLEYQTIVNDLGTVKGLNYGLNLAFYNSINENLSGIQNYAIQFSLPSAGSRDVLATSLSVPQLQPGESGMIFASVTNVGNSTVSDVAIFLHINGEVKSFLYTEILATGENLTLIYYWKNVQKGDYEILAIAPPVPGEIATENNRAMEIVKVGIDHDLAVLLEVFGNGSSYVIIATVQNLGDFDEETFVDIMINGELVNSGFISNLMASTSSVLSFYWSDVDPGVYEITAFVYPVPDETNLGNNMDTIHLDVGPSEQAMVNFNVYDSMTGLPIANAEIFLYNNDTNQWFEFMTNSTGSWQGLLPLGQYIFTVSAIDYIATEGAFLLSSPNDHQILFIYLDTVQVNTIEIISPITGQVVEGGLVLVFFEITSLNNLSTMEIFVNGIFIADFYPTENTVAVPVFANGTNRIELVAWYVGGPSASAYVDIESVGVVPQFTLKSGDILNYRYWSESLQLVVDFNFTVMDYVSQFEVLMNLTYQRSEFNGSVEIANYYLIVNVLNGYISDSDMWWSMMHFIFFSGTASPQYPSGLQENALFFAWTDLLTIVGEGLWNGQEVWIAAGGYNYTAHILKENGLLVVFTDEFGILGLMETTLIAQPSVPPTISPLTPVQYEQGSLGNVVVVDAIDDNPTTFDVFIDGVHVASGVWSSGVPLEIPVDNLGLGIHLFEIFMYDENGNQSYASTTIEVIDTTPPQVVGPDFLSVEEGSNVSIEWNAFDLNPANYSIFVNSSLVLQGYWNNGTILFSFFASSQGVFVVELFVQDMSGNTASHLVVVEVQKTQDLSPPQLRGMPDFSYEENSTNNFLEWKVEETSPSTYQLYRNDVLVQEGNVESDTLLFSIDGLDPGRYVFTLIVTDQGGNQSNDSTIVYVIPKDLPDKIEDRKPKKANGFTSIFAIFSLLMLSVATAKLKKQKI